MSKNKRDIIVLIVLVFVSLTVGLYQLYFQPLMSEVEVAKVDYDKLQDNGKAFNLKNSELKTLETGLAKSKDAAKELDSISVTTIDTPQLTYDIYNACKKYGIKGEDLIFTLQASVVGTTANTGTTTNSTDNSTNSGNSTSTADSSNGKAGANTPAAPAKVLSKLAVNLKVIGDKNKIDLFLKNLNSLTSRRLTVISITLNATSKAATQGNGIIGTNGTSGTAGNSNTPGVSSTTTSGTTANGGNTTVGGTIAQTPVADSIEAQIVFNQYLINDSSQAQSNIQKKYDFYNGVSGYKNFSDMFK